MHLSLNNHKIILNKLAINIFKQTNSRRSRLSENLHKKQLNSIKRVIVNRYKSNKVKTVFKVLKYMQEVIRLVICLFHQEQLSKAMINK